MPETSFYGAPQEVNRRSFSLANALQERCDQLNKEVRELHQEMVDISRLLSDANFELASNEAYDSCLKVLMQELKCWRDGEPLASLLVRLACEAGYVTPYQASKALADLNDA